MYGLVRGCQSTQAVFRNSVSSKLRVCCSGCRLELRTSGLRVQCGNHSATLPHNLPYQLVLQRSWIWFPFKPEFFQVSSFELLKLKHLHCDDLHIILNYLYPQFKYMIISYIHVLINSVDNLPYQLSWQIQSFVFVQTTRPRVDHLRWNNLPIRVRPDKTKATYLLSDQGIG